MRGWVNGWVDREPGGTVADEGRLEGRGGLVVCVSAALGPSAHPPPFLATSTTTPTPPRALPAQLPSQNASHRDVCECVRAVSHVCTYIRLSVGIYVHLCVRVDGTRARKRFYIHRAYVLHLTNITSIYSGLLYVPDM